MKNLLPRLSTAAALALVGVFFTQASLANPDLTLEDRVAALEQELVTARAERIAFDQHNAILIAENAELKYKLVTSTAKKTLQEALGNVIDHAAEMRQQLSESQERIAGISHQLQLAMNDHAELQDELEAKQRSLYAHATTFQRHLEAMPTIFDYEPKLIEPAPIVAETTTPEEADWLALPPIAIAKAPQVEVVEEEVVEVEDEVEIAIVEAEELVSESEAASVAAEEAFIAELIEASQPIFESEIEAETKPDPAVGAVAEDPIVEPNALFDGDPVIESEAPDETIPESSYFEPESLFNEGPVFEEYVPLQEDEQFLGSEALVSPLYSPITIQ